MEGAQTAAVSLKSLNPKFAARITGSYIVDNKHFALMRCAPCGKNAPESTAAIRNALTISAI